MIPYAQWSTLAILCCVDAYEGFDFAAVTCKANVLKQILCYSFRFH